MHTATLHIRNTYAHIHSKESQKKKKNHLFLCKITHLLLLLHIFVLLESQTVIWSPSSTPPTFMCVSPKRRSTAAISQPTVKQGGALCKFQNGAEKKCISFFKEQKKNLTCDHGKKKKEIPKRNTYQYMGSRTKIWN